MSFVCRFAITRRTNVEKSALNDPRYSEEQSCPRRSGNCGQGYDLKTPGASLATAASAAADDDAPGSDERPQKGDLLVVSEGDRAGEIIKPGDLKPGRSAAAGLAEGPQNFGDPQRLAAQRDPRRQARSRRTRRRHARPRGRRYRRLFGDLRPGCPVTAWAKQDGGDKDVFKCVCHNSEYDPRQGAEVVFGPAPRRLAALPLVIADGSLAVAAPFVGKVGAQQAG